LLLAVAEAIKELSPGLYLAPLIAAVEAEAVLPNKSDETALAYDCAICSHQPPGSVECLVEFCPPECKETKS
jgi:hypothetical protein